MNSLRHHGTDRTHRTTLAGVVALGLLAVGCTEAGTASDTPAEPASQDPIYLRIATNEGPDTPSGATIIAFARTVYVLSDGTMRIVPVWEAAGNPPDKWDQAVAETVIGGDNHLGYIPARAFDVLGVHTLQALQTPFLLTTIERTEAVVHSPLADDLMEGLDDIGLTGLQLFPEDLRRIFAYGQPMTRPEDLTGRTIRAPHSGMTAAAFAVVGADVADTSGDAWETAVAGGDLHGVESSLAGMASLDPDHAPVTTAGNVVLFPKINVLVVNRDQFEQLDEEQRALLRQAATVTAEQAAATVSEADAADAFCSDGGRIIQASPDDASALRAAMSRTAAPQEPARTRALAQAIDKLVADLPDTETVTCTRSAAGDGQPPDRSTQQPPARALLVVDTQISSNPELRSPVITAAAGFEGCRSVRDLAAEVDDSDPEVTHFTGTKLVTCANGDVTIGYQARMQTHTPGAITGTWRITDSTVPTALHGSGKLTGDAGSCQTLPAADACVQDTYTGSVRR